MSNVPAIIRNRKRPLTQDYEALRALGMEYIEQFGRELWTDYNIHDPGITTLEALCYAITDLAYRTALPIEDILARPQDDTTRDFFTAREILPCNPVTFEDLRKKIIDVEGVQNAWLLPWTDEPCEGEIKKPAYYIKCEPAQQRFTINSQPAPNALSGFEPRNIEGLYAIRLLLEEDQVLGDLNIPAIDFEMTDKITGQRKAMVRFTFPVSVEKKYPARSGEITLPEQLASGGVTAFTVSNFAAGGKSIFDLYLTIGAQTVQIQQVAFQIRPVQTGLTIATLRDELEADLKSADPAVQSRLISRIFQRFALKVGRMMGIVDKVYCLYQRVRNLCEDVYSIGIVPTQELALCADIETEAGADLEEILGRVQFEIDTFLSPPVRFQTLAEMIRQGVPVQTIFEGPLLRHGFISDEALLASVLRDRIHLSDLYNLIMGIEGVKAIKYLQITNYWQGMAQTDGIPSAAHPSWTLLLGDLYHLNLDKLRSKITFFKGNLPITADRQVAERIYADLKATIAKPRLNPSLAEDNDLALPQGTPHDLSDYYSVQNEFPATYGVGRHGIPAGADLQRKTHIRQFKAYLLFYDQLLANYLAQLQHMKDLYSIGNPDAQTWFFQPVYDHPQPEDEERRNFFGTAPILADFNGMPAGADTDDETAYATQWEAFRLAAGGNPYLQKLQQIAAPEDDSFDRRNRFLDHLLARFAEDFSGYAAMMYSITGQTIEEQQKKTGQAIAEDKFHFLQQYPLLSYNRAKGQYVKFCPPGILDPPLGVVASGKLQLEYDAATEPQPGHATGLHLRAAQLLGMQVADNANLALGIFTAIEVNPGQFRFSVLYQTGHTLLSELTYASEKEAFQAMEVLMALSLTAQPSQHFTIHASGGRFYPRVLQAGNTLYATDDAGFEEEAAAKAALTALLALLQRDGMKVVDHLLLRPLPGDEVVHHVPNPADLLPNDPRLDSVGFFPLCTAFNPDCDCPETDYFSFRVSIVLPYWPSRFRNMDFRRYAEETIHRETPAHILPKFCWVSLYDMWRLEQAYQDWFLENRKYKPVMAVLRPKLKKLITVLNSLTNVYPEGHLHDCDNPGTDNPVILDQTILGTI